MADAPESEQPEIIPKPPSHPITTSLLIISFFATLLGIGIVWNELFGNYLLSSKGGPGAPVEVGMDAHKWEKLKTRSGPIDHYELDYPNEKSQENLVYNVKQELHIGQKFEDAGGAAADK